MEIKFKTESDTRELDSLSPRQFMIAWTTAIRQLVESRARERIGGDFGDVIARGAIQTDTSDPLRHSIYTGGENGYIAEHIHTGGVIRPKRTKYLAIPIDRSVKGLFAREVPGLVFLRKKNEGPNGRCYLARPMKTKIKPLFVLKRSVTQRARPWWPTETEAETESKRFFEENF